MKQTFLLSIVFMLLFFLLYCPAQALDASRDGMKLWLNTILPSLLPFIIITGVILRTGGIERLLSPLEFLWRTLFGLSSAGAYALILGLLCGYPMGAKISSDLYTHGKISRREADYLLTFSNNASPAFLTAYLAHSCLKDRIPQRQIFFLLLLSGGICMLFFRLAVFRNDTLTKREPLPRILPGTKKEIRALSLQAQSSKKETSQASSPGTVLDVSIMNGFETITRLGGYILLFSILSAGIRRFRTVRSAAGYLLLGSLEITTGLRFLSESPLPFGFLYPASMMLTAFGGFCVLAQTKSVLNRDLSFRLCFLAKCLNACITGVLTLFLF